MGTQKHETTCPEIKWGSTLEKADLPAAAAALRHDVVFHSPIMATVGDEVRGHAVVVKTLVTAFAYMGPPVTASCWTRISDPLDHQANQVPRRERSWLRRNS